MNRILTIDYGAVSYLIFLVAFLHAIGFVGNILVPRNIDAGVTAPIGEAFAINVLLLGLFAVQHSVMARPAFKRWWTRFVPQPIERGTYVLVASLLLFLLYWQWRTMPAVVWDMTGLSGRVGLWALFWVGWALITIIGVALMSPAVLWSLAAITLLGIFLPFHPFDLLYNYGARYLTGTTPFPKRAPVRRFVFGFASAWLVATGWAFYIGSDILGFVLGVPLILVAVLASTTHFCIPSLIYNSIFDRAGRRRQAEV